MQVGLLHRVPSILGIKAARDEEAPVRFLAGSFSVLPYRAINAQCL